jgi:hypothetical protein
VLRQTSHETKVHNPENEEPDVQAQSEAWAVPSGGEGVRRNQVDTDENGEKGLQVLVRNSWRCAIWYTDDDERVYQSIEWGIVNAVGIETENDKGD